jgi:hypothetical protein
MNVLQEINVIVEIPVYQAFCIHYGDPYQSARFEYAVAFLQ